MNKIGYRQVIVTIILIFIIFFTYLFIKSYIYDDRDACLDSGICKKGLKVIINKQEIIIDKGTCIINKGQWREQYNDCWFRN